MNEPWHQIPMFPVYRCKEGQFATLQEAARALGRVTAHPEHVLTRRPGNGPDETKTKHALYRARSREIAAGVHARTTLLHEVEAIMRTPTVDVQALLPKPSGTNRKRKAASVVDAALEALGAHIEANWDPAARHVIPLSSGYDSRLVAALLRRLADAHGMEWVGHVRFYTFKPEIDYAHRVWEALDWPAETWFPVDADAVGEDYYADALDFRINGENLSEADRFWPGQLLAQLRLRDAGCLEAPVQGLSGVFADETNKWNRSAWGDLGWFVGCWLMDSPGVLPGAPECRFITPFVGLRWLQLLTQHFLPLAIDQFKLLLLERLRPELADAKRFPNFRFEARKIRQRNLALLRAGRGADPQNRGVPGHLDQQWISAATAGRMEEDYRRSWYARTVGPPRLGFEKQRVFAYVGENTSHYLKAAIYEAMREAGVEVAASR